MEDTLTPEPTAEEAAEMKSAITQWLSEIEELRKGMRRHDAAIEESSAETRAMLADIANILAELKAA